MNLRVQAELDLAESLEDTEGFGLPIVFIDPDGDSFEVQGQVLYDTIIQDPDTGLPVSTGQPVVAVRISSLTRVPIAGEKWICRIPETPDPNAAKSSHAIERAGEDGSSIGFTRFYLTKAIQE